MKYWCVLFYGPLIILGLFVFVISLAAWVFGKWKRGPSVGMAVGLSITVVCLIVLQKDGILGVGVPRKFSPEGWARTKPEDRHFMADSLLGSVQLVGMTADELRELLGEPDYVDTPTLMEYIREPLEIHSLRVCSKKAELIYAKLRVSRPVCRKSKTHIFPALNF